MSDIKEQIFQELTKLEDATTRLRAKNAHAVELIDQSVELLKKLK